MSAEEDNEFIYLVWWQYHDKSGSEFVRAFDNEEAANNLLDILKKHGGDGRNYQCTAVACEITY